MSDAEWNQINIQEILPTTGEDSDLIFLRFSSTDDTAKINYKARNIPHNNERDAPRLVMHVDARAQARYRSYQNIARTIRMETKGQIQTSIRAGRQDFLFIDETKKIELHGGKSLPL